MGWFDPLFDRLLDCTDPKFLDRLLLKEQSDPDQGLHVWQVSSAAFRRVTLWLNQNIHM